MVGGQTLSGTISTASLNTAVGAANVKTFSLNVSSILTTFAEVAGARVSFVYKHTGGSDGVVLFIDATGLQVTTSELCGAPSDDMRSVPMTDTYDADVLQFLDATLTPSGSSVTGTAPNRIGTLTWDLGPLRAQQTKTVTVRFLAAEQDTNGDGESDVGHPHQHRGGDRRRLLRRRRGQQRHRHGDPPGRSARLGLRLRLGRPRRDPERRQERRRGRASRSSPSSCSTAPARPG